MADEKAKRGKAARLWHRTRHAPRRAEELLDGGSMYWVIKGRVAARQRLIGFEKETDEEGRKFCFIQLDPELVPTRLDVIARFRDGVISRRMMRRRTSPSDRLKRTSRRRWRPNCASWDFYELKIRFNENFGVAASDTHRYIYAQLSQNMRSNSPVD